MDTVHLVLRCATDATAEVALLVCPDEDIARAHAATATTATGHPHTVRSLHLAHTAPPVRTWHALTLDVHLTGQEAWRRERPIVTFAGWPDEISEPSSTWQLLVRSAPSQPPSRVRIEIVGPDRDWCLAAARDAWAQAAASPAHREACEIEAMFTQER